VGGGRGKSASLLKRPKGKASAMGKASREGGGGVKKPSLTLMQGKEKGEKSLYNKPIAGGRPSSTMYFQGKGGGGIRPLSLEGRVVIGREGKTAVTSPCWRVKYPEKGGKKEKFFSQNKGGGKAHNLPKHKRRMPHLQESGLLTCAENKEKTKPAAESL